MPLYALVFTLQRYALHSKVVATLNSKAAAAGQPRKFALAAPSINAASALRPHAAAIATSRHLLETPDDDPSSDVALCPHAVPSSVLLLTTGLPIGAVADIMGVELLPSGDGTEPTIAFTLDVVHKPDTISELQQHPKQSLDDDAHYLSTRLLV
jgi:hypothetical protein